MLVALLLANLPASARAVDAPCKRISLLVASTETSREGQLQRLRIYTFADGVLIDSLLVGTVRRRMPSFERQTVHVMDHRYVVSIYGDVVDVREGHLIPKGGLNVGDSHLCGLGDGCVYFRAGRDGACQRLDLVSGRIEAAEYPERLSLPGIRAPSGLRSVVLGPPSGGAMYPPQDIWLHEVGAEPRRLGDGFGARMHILSSSLPTAPVLWLDDERILTQRTTGDLVVLRMDGSVEPLCTVPTETDVRNGILFNGDTGGWFERSPSGGIIYAMMFLNEHKKLARHRFLIDTDRGTYEPYGRGWVPLGHGFDHGEGTGWNTEVQLRYQGRSIGSCNEFSARDALAAEGYLAVAENYSLRIWSKATGTWIPIPLAVAERLTGGGILAWLAP